MKLYGIIFCLSFLALVLAQPQTGKERSDKEQINKDNLKRAIEDFTQNVYIHLATTLKNENFVFSPLSLHSALSMVYLGSKQDSNTFKELRRSLGILTSPNALRDSFKTYIKFLLKEDTVKYGNHIWVKEGYEIKDDYKKTVENYMNANITSLNFNKNTAADEVNQWVSETTNGKINKIVNGFSDNALMFLANTLYFKDSWLYSFEDEEFDGTPIKGKFKTYEDSLGTEIDMMQLTSKTIKYEKFELPQKAGSFEAIRIPYNSEKFDLKIILPADDLRLLEDFTNLTFVRDTDNFNLFRETGGKFTGEVNLKMPPFKITSKVKAKEVFKKLNVKQLFTETAELDLITDKKPIGISGISHESVIEVNANGTEGAAATGVEIVFFSASPKGEKEVVVDRPFIFVLEDKVQQIPLLVGRVVNPLK